MRSIEAEAVDMGVEDAFKNHLFRLQAERQEILKDLEGGYDSATKDT